MAAETSLKFKIDDVEYELPAINEFDMDEWEIVSDYSGLIYSDFAPLATYDENGGLVEGDEAAERERQRKTNGVKFHKALIHIAYRRAHPGTEPDEIKQLVGKAKQIPFLAAIHDAGADEEKSVPLDTTEPREPSSPKSSRAQQGSKSPASMESSDDQGDQLAATGTSG